ncbi:hypothetical protein E2C01_088780 [Portunus trituberculatus]|uniref:Uncharacterized protein n=1 Tax=Portunus trituberculatus TaxID=210409 RepID=A0A5B7JGZ6_PORTR|nr:hypothetical protein [Portunus trituberculatus]
MVERKAIIVFEAGRSVPPYIGTGGCDTPACSNPPECTAAERCLNVLAYRLVSLGVHEKSDVECCNSFFSTPFKLCNIAALVVYALVFEAIASGW